MAQQRHVASTTFFLILLTYHSGRDEGITTLLTTGKGLLVANTPHDQITYVDDKHSEKQHCKY